MALSVKIGSVYDYKEVQGMAHFLEHMMYLGSKKFPNKNEFSEFLVNHGSEDDNAYTMDDRTMYYYDIGDDDLQKSLELFGALLEAPLLSADGVEHEK